MVSKLAFGYLIPGLALIRLYWDVNVPLTLQHFMYIHFETFCTFNLFSANLLFLIIVCFFFIYFGNFDVFSHMLNFAIWAFWLILGVLTLTKFVEFVKWSTVRGGGYFLIFQPKDMLNLFLDLDESQPMYANKR